MKPLHVLILGASQMQVPALDAARQMGWKTIVADANPQAAFAHRADYFEPVDLADPEAMLEMARRYYQAGELQGIFTAGTDFSATVAYVAEHLGLPGNSYQAALNASVKSRMRQAFKEHGVPSPGFVEAGPRAIPDISGLSFPLVVKPVDNMGARGVSKVSQIQELDAALTLAKAHSRSATAIIEEWIDGPEYSLDSLLIDNTLYPCGLARRHIYFPPYFVELGHTLPAELNPEASREMFAVLHAAGLACGLKTGALKGDIFMTTRGPVVGEIANRLSGGYMSGWTYPLASGINLTQAALKLCVGLDPGSLEALWHTTSAERAIVSIPGKVAQIIGLELAESQQGVEQIFLRSTVGTTVVFPRNNVEKAGNIVANLPKTDEAIQAAEGAVQKVLLVLEAPNNLTEAWLTSPWHSTQAHGLPGSWPAAYPQFYQSLEREYSALKGTAQQNSATEPRSAILRAPRALLAAQAETCVWDYRKLAQALAMLTSLRGLQFADNGIEWPAFWQALAKGGLQAALYLFDREVKGRIGL